MNKRCLEIISIFILFFFSVNLLLPAATFAEAPCWNDGSIAYSEGGRDGATGIRQGDINQRGRTEAADPVDVANGNYFYKNQDLFIPSPGLALEVTRFYNSLDTYEGPFGIGTSHSYNIFLLEVSDGSQTYILRRNANGSKDKFLKNPNGSYSASEGCYDTLTKDATGYSVHGKHGLVQHFDLDGKLKSITDRNQNKINLEYDSGTGVLTKVTDRFNRTIDFNYNTERKVTSIMDFIGRTTTYEYDQENNLVYVTTPATEDYPTGLTTAYSYDGQHRLTSITDAKGQTYIYLEYEENSRVVELTYGGGSYYFSYHVNSTTLTDPKDFKTDYVLNSNGTVRAKIQHSGWRLMGSVMVYLEPWYAASYVYNENRERIKIVYPRGNWVKYTYDDKGNVLEIRRKGIGAADTDDPVNDIVTSFSYEQNYNFIKTLTDPRGNVTTYTYDYELDPDDPDYGESGNLIKITYPTVGATTPETQFTYNSYGQVETATDPNNNVTKYVYSPDTGYLKQIINDSGTGKLNYTTEMAYDSVGNVTSIKNAQGNTTTFTYNALNQLTQVNSPAPFNYSTKYSYDRNGNLTKLERQADEQTTAWQTTQYTYTILDQLERITDDLGNVTRFSYDANGNRTSIRDAEGNTTTYKYDERDLLWKVTDALGNVTEYGYDKNGNLKEIKDARLNRTGYAYDDFDRLITTTYEDDTTKQYIYDKNSNLVSKTDQDEQSITYVYDALTRLTSKIYPDTSTVQYHYDAGSRLTSVTDSSGTTHYDYDALNRVIQLTYPDANTVSYEYDALGNRTKLTYPDNTYITYTYDELSRLTSINDEIIATIASYSYDTLSRRTQLDLINATQTTYQYDSLNRLTAIHNPASTMQYSYDKVGNRKTMTVDSANTHNYTYDDIYQLTNVDYPAGFTFTDTNYNYDAVGNRISRVNGGSTSYTANNMNQYTEGGDTDYTYDNNGNLTGDDTYTFTYDYENRLILADDGIRTTEYGYDAFGRRIQKNVDGTITNYVYDGDQVIMETDATGSTTAKYIYGPGIDEPICVIASPAQQGEAIYYYHFDGLGSVTALTDPSGTLTESYEYDIYGNITSSFSSVGNPYYFTGRRYDPETGLYYYRARYYSPSTGRFLQVDPIGYFGGINLYTYVGNNPVNFVDPFGLKKWLYITTGGSGGLGLTIGGGKSYIVDIITGEYHEWNYGNVGVGPKGGGYASVQVGMFETFEDPSKISKHGFAVSAFGVAGFQGLAAHVTGPGPFGKGEMGSAAGWAGGVGFGISPEYVRTWGHKEGSTISPELQQLIKEILEKFPAIKSRLKEESNLLNGEKKVKTKK